MEDLTKVNSELSAALHMIQIHLDLYLEVFNNINDSCDPYRIAKKCLYEIDELGQR